MKTEKFAKKTLTFLTILLAPFVALAKENSAQKFFLQPLISIEYSAPEISQGGVNTRFANSKGFFEQVADAENIALGVNLRVHQNLGFNFNWAQTELDSTALQGVSLSRKANLRIDNYNLSALGYYPVVKDNLDFFVEGGVSRIYSSLSYVDSSGNFFSDKENRNKSFYGVGFQAQFSKSDFLRFSVQKYSGNLGALEAKFSTIRIGYLKAF